MIESFLKVDEGNVELFLAVIYFSCSWSTAKMVPMVTLPGAKFKCILSISIIYHTSLQLHDLIWNLEAWDHDSHGDGVDGSVCGNGGDGDGDDCDDGGNGW